MIGSWFTCFGTIISIIGAVLVLIFVVIPLIAFVFSFVGRVIRFIVHEMRDIIKLPVAIVVSVVKLISAILCIVLARWDLVQKKMAESKARIVEAGNLVATILVHNPLRIFAIDPFQKQKAQFKPEVQKNRKKNTPAGPADQFGGYRIIGTLPAGGSGAKIYVAQPDNESSTVVIKSFNISTGSPLPQIVRESRAMEAAKKLGLVLEHHLDENRFWYAMPHHPGDHLGVVTTKLHGKSKHLTSKQLRTVLRYQQSLLQTLHTYHQTGLWHKDVKPDNIIIHNDMAHLVDLGLVTPLASAMTLTTHGTEYFRDPELVRQAMRGVKVHQVDGSKFDVFGAGAVLYFMLENTFPAHGGLSDFSKQSPEGIRWIVRRAMADYDKRYNSVEEMLGDIEAILRESDIASVRPADLPSLQGAAVELENPRAQARRLPAKSTPSTGGGPFQKKQYRTSPMGVLAIIVAIVVAVPFVFLKSRQSHNANNLPHEVLAEEFTRSILDYEHPNGRVLLINDLPIAVDTEVTRIATNFVAQLGVAGWDVFMDPELEARVRTWLPEDETSTVSVTQKLEDETLSGVLVMKQDRDDNIIVKLIEETGTNLFSIDSFVTQ